MRQIEIDTRIVNKNVKFSKYNEVINNRYFNKLFNFIKEKGLYFDIIVCTGNYTTDNRNELWLAYGTNNEKVHDERLSSHIREAYASLNPETDFCIDFNLSKITDCDPYILHQDIVKKIILTELIIKCFNDNNVTVPDRISLYDAIAIENIYRETSDILLTKVSNKNIKGYSENIAILKNIIKNSDCVYNPLHPNHNNQAKAKKRIYFSKIENIRNTLFGSFCKKNKVSIETVIRNTNEIVSFEIEAPIAKELIKRLSFYPDILYFCSKPTYPCVFKRTISHRLPKDLKVCNFIIPASFKSEFRYIYQSIKFPGGFKNSLTSLKKNNDITFFCIPSIEYPFYEKYLKENNIPFSIGYKKSDFDIDTICIYYRTQYTFDIIQLMHSIADASQGTNAITDFSINNTDYFYSAIKKYMEIHPEQVISTRKE